jgi:hypothetical protein
MVGGGKVSPHHRIPVMPFHLPGSQLGSVAEVRTAAIGVPEVQGDAMTSILGWLTP